MPRVDIVSDMVCPWCLVGKRQMELAVDKFRAQFPEADAPEIHWHPFQLNPTLPESGMPRSQYLERKFGTADPGAIYDRVKQAAAEVGIELPIEGVTMQPNTAHAHALMAACEAEPDLANALVERLFTAYFIEHENLTDSNVLEAQARAVGVTDDAIAQARSEAALQAIRERDADVRDKGIRGVPFFIIDNQRALNGAVGVDAIFAALKESFNSRGHSEKTA